MLAHALPQFSDLRIVVLGDVMLDRFIRGRVERVSPEAPIPVLLVEGQTSMLGGAANVARNISSLGGSAVLIGVVGDDAAGRELQAMADAEPGISADFIITTVAPTIEKVRYVADQQQMLRADFECLVPDLSEALEKSCLRHLAGAHALILSDYAKGVLSPSLLGRVIAAARAARVPVIVDPKNANLSRYDGATLLTPNRYEAGATTGIRGEEDDATAAAARAILKTLPNTDAVLITRGPRGMTLVQRNGELIHNPALAREVFDVSGAGDTVIASLALTLATGLSLFEAVHIANTAAGVVVGKHGTATVTMAELQRALHPIQLASDFKIMTALEAAELAADWRRRQKIVGFTNGCFDLIHPGHVSLLGQARTECDHLIVGLNTDASVKRLKGPNRPIQDETARAIVLGSLRAVDAVVLFDEDTPLELIKIIRPDVLIKGQDYTVATVVGGDLVQTYGGRIFLADIKPGQSTTNTITRIARKSL